MLKYIFKKSQTQTPVCCFNDMPASPSQQRSRTRTGLRAYWPSASRLSELFMVSHKRTNQSWSSN